MSNEDMMNASAPALEIPEAVAAALSGWVQQVAEQTAAPVRDALAEIERLTAELRDARLAATTARDNFENEVKTLRAELESLRAKK